MPAMNDDQTRPTADECWSDFWSSVAVSWTRLPIEIRQEYAVLYPRGSATAREDFAAG